MANLVDLVNVRGKVAKKTRMSRMFQPVLTAMVFKNPDVVVLPSTKDAHKILKFI